MQDNNLDDLIIDNINPKDSNTKSFLTIIGLAIVVLIIAIILTKIILKDPDSDLLLEENNTKLISPDLTLQSMTQEVVTKPLIPEAEEVKPDINLVSSPKEVSAPTEIKTVKIANELAGKEEIKREEKEAQTQELARQKKEALEKARIKEEKAKQSVDNTQVANPYFIQVGSFSKTPSERFLSVIKNGGFNYQITATSNNGTKKLLIGPYKIKADADDALIKVKDRINKSAYIIKK
jgi:DedD protein